MQVQTDLQEGQVHKPVRLRKIFLRTCLLCAIFEHATINLLRYFLNLQASGQ